MSSEIYNKIQSITDYALRRKAVKALSENDKKCYVRYQTNLRQRRYMSDPRKRQLMYKYVNEYKKMIKMLYPEKARQNRIKHAAYMRAYRARKKAQVRK